MDDDTVGMGDENMSSAVRMARFESGLMYQINRTTLPNGTCCLAVTSDKRSTDR
jgi:hypothetical protein